MTDFWRPSIDPLQELFNHSEALKHHEESILNIANAINENAAALENLARHNQYLIKEIHKLRADLEKLKLKGNSNDISK